MYKRELFDNIRYPLGLYYEDLGTTPKIFMLNIKYSKVDEYLYNYVQHNSSIMHKSTDKIFDIYKIFDSLIDFAQTKKVYKEKHDELEMCCIFHVLIGTSYRASSHKKFSRKMIKDIYNKVISNFPNWYKNNGIKKLDFYYRFFLRLYRYKLFTLIFILLKIFGKLFTRYR